MRVVVSVMVYESSEAWRRTEIAEGELSATGPSAALEKAAYGLGEATGNAIAALVAEAQVKLDKQAAEDAAAQVEA